MDEALLTQTAEALLLQMRAAAIEAKTATLHERIERLRRLRRVLVAEVDATARQIAQVTAKPVTDALVNEVYPVLQILQYYEKHAARILRDRRIGRLFSFPQTHGLIVYRPYGTVLVIGPNNYPFQLTLVPALSAMAAGNAVVAKVGPAAPEVASLLHSLVRKADWPEHLVSFVAGDAKFGRALIRGRPDKIFFTGGAAAGRDILRQAADALVPVDLELGGNDAALVFEDAPFERAVHGVVYGAFLNSGQVCVSIQRLFVHMSIYDRFVSAVVEETRRLRPLQDEDGELSPPLSNGASERLRRLVEDALGLGAALAMPGSKENISWRSVILKNVTPAMRVMQEEAFAPLLACMPFENETEAIALANSTEYGLNASVWTTDLARGRRVALALETGNCAVNDVIKNIGHPAMPFGGNKRSGFGRYHGSEGLYAFSQTQSVLLHRGRGLREVNWFPYSATHYRRLVEFSQFLFGHGALLRRAWRFRDTLKYFRSFFKAHAD